MKKVRQNQLVILMGINVGMLAFMVTIMIVGLSLMKIQTNVQASVYEDEIVTTQKINPPSMIEESEEVVAVDTEAMTEEEKIDSYISEICKLYPNVGQALVKSVIYHESRFNPKAKNGNCLGLMQVSKRWHSKRAARLGVTDFYDPYSNILLGVDYLSAITEKYKDPALVLMIYNMGTKRAWEIYSSGQTTKYARSVLAKAEKYKKGE